MANAFKDIITRLERQRASIERALAALREVDETDAVSAPLVPAPKTRRKSKGKRTVSDEARARMVEGQKKRWAAKRAAEKSSLKKAARKRSVPKTTSQES